MGWKEELAMEQMDQALKDLRFAQQLSKEGLLGSTTKCCATGTRIQALFADVGYPLITDNFDTVDAVLLSREVDRLPV
jgi:hypothetical protein